MLRYLTSLALLSTLCTCGSAPTNAVLPALGTATAPVRYEQFADLEGLFQQQNDTTYLVNFWATWCKPCREEIPLLQQLLEDKADQPLRVVLVSLDTEESAIARIPAFLAAEAPSVAAVVLTDEDPAWGKSIDRVWTGALPTTIIYQQKRRFVYRRAFNTYADLEAAVSPLLGQ